MSVGASHYWQETFQRSTPPRREYPRRLFIARGYYGAYHHSALLVQNAGIPRVRNKGGMHEQIHLSLSKCPDSFPGYNPGTDIADISRLGADLKWLKKRRRDADYKLDMDISVAYYREFHSRLTTFRELLNSVQRQLKLPLSV